MTTRKRTFSRKKKSSWGAHAAFAITLFVGIMVGGVAMHLAVPSPEEICYELYGESIEQEICVAHVGELGL